MSIAAKKKSKTRKKPVITFGHFPLEMQPEGTHFSWPKSISGGEGVTAHDPELTGSQAKLAISSRDSAEIIELDVAVSKADRSANANFMTSEIVCEGVA